VPAEEYQNLIKRNEVIGFDFACISPKSGPPIMTIVRNNHCATFDAHLDRVTERSPASNLEQPGQFPHQFTSLVPNSVLREPFRVR